jgi:ribosomal 50S subunit-recycling heat shock protein
MIECSATDTVTINGAAADPSRPLKPGDKIELAGDQLTLISVPQDR